ncbi:hypothetical protein, partial [uncultured Microbulbifer sp.]|uniref:hypothetical protein n=1 Tax=uncultured Microbulbifer sp. TaxID=348147 RepID=UPI0025ED77CD
MTPARIFVFLAVVLLLNGCEETPNADRIFINGDILTVDRNNSIASALALKHGRILAIGNRDEIEALSDTD